MPTLPFFKSKKKAHTNVYCENLILERSTWINDKLTLGYSKYR